MKTGTNPGHRNAESAAAPTLHRVAPLDVRRMAWHTLLLGGLFSLLLAIPLVLYYQAEDRHLRNLAQAQQERVLRLASQTIRQEMQAVLSDLRYLSQNTSLKAYVENPGRAQYLDLANDYLGLARQKQVYDQIRFIGLDGMERMRIDYAGGMPTLRPAQALRDKSDRPYMRESIWLAPGQIHVSPFDLNQENGAVELPIKPTIRFAAPVADQQGQIRGILVLNYQGRRLLDKLVQVDGQRGKLWLLNPAGDWMVGPSRQEDWSFMLPASVRSDDMRFAAFRKQAAREKSGVFQADGAWVRFERIYPLAGEPALPTADLAQPAAADRYYWTLAIPLPTMAHGEMAWPRGLTYAALALFAFLAAGGLVLVFNRGRALAQVTEKLIDNLPLLVAYVDREQRYRFNNQAYQRAHGRSPRELYGMSMQELLGEEHYQEVRPHIDEVLAGRPVTFERQVSHTGANIQDVAISYLPDFSRQGEVRGFIVIVNDVSRIKQGERRKRERMLELAHVSRIASMVEMTTEIAHEINQPLASIAMYSAAGLRTVQGNPEWSQLATWLEAINGQAKRASDIVRRVRQFVQHGEHRRVEVNLNQLVEEVVALLRHEARSQDVEIDLQLVEGLPAVHGELVLLEQVIFNLVRNAIDALRQHPGGRRITLATSFDAAEVVCEVRDTGPGVDPALGERIFESFVTTRQEGLGMGLTISRTIVEAHSGKLRYVTNPEGGLTLSFCLPRVQA